LAKQSNPTNIAREMLKIKKTFPNLQNKKIKIVQKIISGQDKPKPKISMTTKGPSHKQVIILMKDVSACQCKQLHQRFEYACFQHQPIPQEHQI